MDYITRIVVSIEEVLMLSLTIHLIIQSCDGDGNKYITLILNERLHISSLRGPHK